MAFADELQGRKFSPEGYGLIIRQVLACGYRFVRVDELDKAHPGNSFILRHDVDISPKMAGEFGAIAFEHGVRANFFFQLNAETYNAFSAKVASTIRTLREQNHCVGLHIDLAWHPNDEDAIATTLNWFARCVAPIDNVVSFHRPRREMLGLRFMRFNSAYDSQIFGEGRYFSDSARSSEFVLKLDEALRHRTAPLQLLLHPGWWGGYKDAASVWRELSERRHSELVEYALANFAKAFGEVIKHENRPFRL